VTKEEFLEKLTYFAGERAATYVWPIIVEFVAEWIAHQGLFDYQGYDISRDTVDQWRKEMT
jgi:hypothetical protein